MSINIRQETVNDRIVVEELTREAFWNLYRPGCDEHYLVHIMRDHPDFIGDLAYVAEIDNRIVGNIMYTKSYLINEKEEKLETVTFGPLCVHPEFQRKGIGSALISFTKQLVIQKDYPAIIIYGDPHNYYKQGFKTGKDYNISTMEGKYPLGLLVLDLGTGKLNNHSWRFKESSVFELDQEKVENYDQLLPFKEKTTALSQNLFSMLIRSFVE